MSFWQKFSVVGLSAALIAGANFLSGEPREAMLQLAAGAAGLVVGGALVRRPGDSPRS